MLLSVLQSGFSVAWTAPVSRRWMMGETGEPTAFRPVQPARDNNWHCQHARGQLAPSQHAWEQHDTVSMHRSKLTLSACTRTTGTVSHAREQLTLSAHAWTTDSQHAWRTTDTVSHVTRNWCLWTYNNCSVLNIAVGKTVANHVHVQGSISSMDVGKELT